MARARNIKPGFFKNEDLVELPFEYRLLFAGLWTLADREGRLEDRPKRIKMELFPADNVDIDHGLDELARYGFVERYVADGIRVVAIAKFAEHQSPHNTEKASELPDKNGAYTDSKRISSTRKTLTPSSDNGGVTVKEPLDNGGFTVDSRKHNDGNRPDSLIHRFTDSPNPKPPLTPPCRGGESPSPTAEPTAEPQSVAPLPNLKRERKERVCLKTFLDRCQQAGEKAISDHTPLLEYVDRTGLPLEFIQIAWEVFKAEHLPSGGNGRRLQADWRRHFMNYVTKGYYRLWYATADGQYALSTAGVQAQKMHAEEVAA